MSTLGKNITVEEAIRKGVTDLSEKHFSRFGEFLVSFELSKWGWNVYNPVYDEYIDVMIHKYVCKKCKKKMESNTATKMQKLQ